MTDSYLFSFNFFKVLSSLSEEGRLLLWDLDDKFEFPIIGFNLRYKLGKVVMPIYGVCMDASKSENFTFIIGTFDGNIYKCGFNYPVDNNFDYIFDKTKGVIWRRAVRRLMSNMNEKELFEMKQTYDSYCLDNNMIDLNPNEFFKLKPDVNKLYKNCLKSNFEKHFGLINSVQYNEFIRSMFATISIDGSLRIYYPDHCGSKFVFSYIENESYFTAIQWSPLKPNIIFAGTSKNHDKIDVGDLIVLKIIKNDLKVIEKYERRIEKSKLKFSIVDISYNLMQRNIISITYEDGIIDILKLSDDYLEYNAEEYSTLLNIQK